MQGNQKKSVGSIVVTEKGSVVLLTAWDGCDTHTDSRNETYKVDLLGLPSRERFGGVWSEPRWSLDTVRRIRISAVHIRPGSSTHSCATSSGRGRQNLDSPL